MMEGYKQKDSCKNWQVCKKNQPFSINWNVFVMKNIWPRNETIEFYSQKRHFKQV